MVDSRETVGGSSHVANDSQRNQKLKALFKEYLNQKTLLISANQSPMHFGNLTDAEKKKLCVKKLTDEQYETFEPCEGARPMRVLEKVYELRWKDITDRRDDEITDFQRKMAARVLDLMKRNQLLETALIRREQNRTLCNFFEEPNKEPTPQIAELLDLGIGNGMLQITRQSSSITDVIDEEMRKFLNKTDTAKRILLDTMLAQPQYLPDEWGGSFCVRRAFDREAEKKEKTDAITAPSKKETENELKQSKNKNSDAKKPLDVKTVEKTNKEKKLKNDRSVSINDSKCSKKGSKKKIKNGSKLDCRGERESMWKDMAAKVLSEERKKKKKIKTKSKHERKVPSDTKDKGHKGKTGTPSSEPQKRLKKTPSNDKKVGK